MSLSAPTDRAGAAAYLAIALVFAPVSLSLAWLRVEGVITPAASQIVTLGVGAVVVIVALRVLELYAGRSE